MISKIFSVVPYGFEGKVVEVEGDINKGLPAFNIVGMANKTVNESKERVRSALVNSDFYFPAKKVTINLAPADLPKDGAYLDLPIALSILVLSGQLLRSDVRDKIFVGELSLDGEIKPVRGVINIVEAAKKAGYCEIYVPSKNLAQASLISGVTVYGVKKLQDLYLALKNQLTLQKAENTLIASRDTSSQTGPKLDHVLGQALAKRALSIAIAGRHNILISGPPGAGKTLLAKVAANLLPDLTPDEIVAITKLYSIAGLIVDQVVSSRPFRSPHHTASATSIIGGGAMAEPGEISLAHGGILFLDEMPEFPRSVLEALRQPLEDKNISISRTNRKTTYPADFMLIATMNPCPCGYLNDPKHECRCTEIQIQNYQKRISGPLLDRIDMNIVAEKTENTDLLKEITTDCREHNVVKNNITEAISRQRARYKVGGVYNSSLSSFQVSRLLKMDSKAERILADASEKLNLSARSYFKTIKVAQTIADLAGAKIISSAHIAEALSYRRR